MEIARFLKPRWKIPLRQFWPLEFSLQRMEGGKRSVRSGFYWLWADPFVGIKQWSNVYVASNRRGIVRGFNTESKSIPCWKTGMLTHWHRKADMEYPWNPHLKSTPVVVNFAAYFFMWIRPISMGLIQILNVQRGIRADSTSKRWHVFFLCRLHCHADFPLKSIGHRLWRGFCLKFCD